MKIIDSMKLFSWSMYISEANRNTVRLNVFLEYTVFVVELIVYFWRMVNITQESMFTCVYYYCVMYV